MSLRSSAGSLTRNGQALFAGGVAALYTIGLGVARLRAEIGLVVLLVACIMI